MGVTSLYMILLGFFDLGVQAAMLLALHSGVIPGDVLELLWKGVEPGLTGCFMTSALQDKTRLRKKSALLPALSL